MSLINALMSSTGSGGDPGDTAQLLANDFTTQGFTGTIYSGLKLDADGNAYERQAAGGWSSIGAWLVNGTNSDFYVRRTIDSGSLTTDAGGSVGDLRQLSTDRIWDVQKLNNGEKETNVTFTIVNSADNAIFATRTYNFFANRGLL